MRVLAFPMFLLLAYPVMAQTLDEVLPRPKLVIIGQVVVEVFTGPTYLSILSELPKKFGEKKKEETEHTGVRRLFVRVHRAVEGSTSTGLIEVLWEYKYSSNDDIAKMLLRPRPWPMGAAPPEGTIQGPVLRLWRLELQRADDDPRCSTRQGARVLSGFTVERSIPCYRLVPAVLNL